ncbi:MAG TPA: VOC family protein [Ktedonosporobacter sp.]|nr:VOC family protein [Ktedonosporobacter sp.]
MSALHFSHIALSCHDPRETERFYTRHFGFKRARVVPLGGEEQIVFLKRGMVSLELFRATQVAPVPPAGGAGPEYAGYRHIAFQVENVDAKLAEMGKEAIITLGPMNFDDFIPGWRSVWIADPDGNSVEISQGYVEQEHPPGFSSV